MAMRTPPKGRYAAVAVDQVEVSKVGNRPKLEFNLRPQFRRSATFF
jgi:hypothetical protein